MRTRKFRTSFLYYLFHYLSISLYIYTRRTVYTIYFFLVIASPVISCMSHTVSDFLYVHCPKNNRRLRVKSEPLTSEADTTDVVYLCLAHIYQTKTISSATAVTSIVFMWKPAGWFWDSVAAGSSNISH